MFKMSPTLGTAFSIFQEALANVEKHGDVMFEFNGVNVIVDSSTLLKYGTVGSNKEILNAVSNSVKTLDLR